MSKTLIVGFDDTEQSRRAISHAADDAKQSGAAVHVVHILEWSPYSFHTPEELAERHKRREEELERANALVQPVVDQLNKDGVKTTCEIRHGNATELLCKIADQQPGAQIVIGRTGGSGFAQRLLGSLAHSLVQVAPVPVTIVP